MFYDVFDRLCKDRNTYPSIVCVELGLGKSTPSYWKRSGSTPKMEILKKIAQYFDVTVDYLSEKSDRDVEIRFVEPTTKADWIELLDKASPEMLQEIKSYVDYLIYARSGKA